VSFVTAGVVFVVALVSVLLHHDTINGHVLTPAEELPSGLLVASIAAGLAFLGTWLGLLGADKRHLTYLAGFAIAVLYLGFNFLVDVTFRGSARTVTIPSHEADVLFMRTSIELILWGTGAPFISALVVRRTRLFRGRHWGKRS
jgi:hypothetical protein